MNSVRYLAFEPRDGVGEAIEKHLNLSFEDWPTPRAIKTVIQRLDEGFYFSMTAAIDGKMFNSEMLVTYEQCTNQSRDWQYTVIHLMTRDIIKQYQNWKRPN